VGDELLFDAEVGGVRDEEDEEGGGGVVAAGGATRTE
jgi:hypothetical protein